MTALLSKSELKTLMTKTGGLRISIYMPTHRAGPDTQQDPLRFRKLLRMAEKQLLESGMRTPDVQALLAPAQELLELPGFWREQADGLAVFIDSELTHHYQLPIRFKRLLVVADRFQLKPLLPLFSGDGQFYVLALSQNEIRLLKGSRDNVEVVELDSVPESLAEALKDYNFEKQLQWHSSSAAPSRSGKRSAIFYGHGATVDISKSNLLRYFQQVDKGLWAVLSADHTPLILAGVDYLLPIYREASAYPHVLETGIVGNPEHLHPGDLQAQAWEIVRPYFQQAQSQAAARYQQLAGAGSELASADLGQILPAAFMARIETLFVAQDVQCWGTFDPTTNRIELRATVQPGDQDLLDLAAVQTYLTGGTVFAVPPDEVPGRGQLAAVFRY